jgi:hypothetical protein
MRHVFMVICLVEWENKQSMFGQPGALVILDNGLSIRWQCMNDMVMNLKSAQSIACTLASAYSLVQQHIPMLDP